MLIFDEFEYAKQLIGGGKFIEKEMSVFDLNTLSKYYRLLGMKDSAIFKALDSFCSASSEYYQKDIFEKRLKRAVRNSKKFKLRKPMSVLISKKEKDSLLAIKEDRVRKTAFALLVLAKFFTFTSTKIASKPPEPGCKFYYYRDLNEAFDLMKLKLSKTDKIDILYKLQHDKIIDVKYNGTLQILIAENVSDDCFEIKFMENLNLYYEYLFTNSNIGFCNKCGRPIKKITKERGKFLCRQCIK